MRAIAFAILAHGNLLILLKNAEMGKELSKSAAVGQLVLFTAVLICIIGGW